MIEVRGLDNCHDRGVVPGKGDGSLWVYRTVPMVPVLSLPSPKEIGHAGEPLRDAVDRLAEMTAYRVARRETAERHYRRVHLLGLNLPGRGRHLLFGAQLRTTKAPTPKEWWRELKTGDVHFNIYENDLKRVGRALAKAELAEPDRAVLDMAAGWRHDRHGVQMKTAFLRDFGDRDLGENPFDPLGLAGWAKTLMDATESPVLSVRGLVEPGRISHKAWQRERPKVQAGAVKNGAGEKTDRMLKAVDARDQVYAFGPTATVAHASILFGAKHPAQDYDPVRDLLDIVDIPDGLQEDAASETLPGSQSRRNQKKLQDLDVSAVAMAGLNVLPEPSDRATPVNATPAVRG